MYRLEQRGLLECPIVGVAFEDWSLDQLVERARASIVGAGEELVDAVFARLSARLSYVSGDFADDATYGRVADEIEGKRLPVLCVEVPPSLFGTVVRGLAGAGLADDERVVVEKPFGHDLPLGRRRDGESTTFFLFSLLCIVSFVFVWRLVPEMKGRSQDEFQERWVLGGDRMLDEETA